MTLEPLIVRGIRVSRYVAMHPDMYADLLELVAPTVVNALVFDTKDETGTVLYDTEVAYAADGGVAAVALAFKFYWHRILAFFGYGGSDESESE